MSDPRRRIPRTDDLLKQHQDSPLADAPLRALITEAQASARRGEITPEEVSERVRRGAAAPMHSLTPVLNATGVIVHTNIGRAPLSTAATQALLDAAGYVDVEMDLEAGVRSRTRGAGARRALLEATPGAEDALVVNNGAAALLLAASALASGGELIISRGEMIEIGAGFRLPELIESARVDLHEIGATNRTHLADYRSAAQRSLARAILKVHPSNYRMVGFTCSVRVAELRQLGLPLIVDIGSGLLQADPALPDEPDAASALAEGADIVLASGDKLLGGPQAGILLGRAEIIARLKNHPLSRAMRIDKLRLAALEATLRARRVPVTEYLHVDVDKLKQRTQVLAAAVGLDEAALVAHDGRVGGGGAPGHPLPGWALSLPEHYAQPLRSARPAVLTRVHAGRCLVDLRCIPPEEDARVADALRAVMG